MKVTQVESRIIQTPAHSPLVIGLPPDNATREFVTVEVRTDEGVEGIGVTFFGAALTKALKAAVDALGDLTAGEDPMRVEAVAAKLRRASSGAGPGGIFTLALSAIDMALWDIKGKALGQSVNRLIGGYRDRAPAYASGALMRPHPLDYIVKTGPRLVEMGFRQMKTQLGAEPSVAAALERIRVQREAVGDEIDLMCDINQLWNVNQAIEIGRRLEDLPPLLAGGRHRLRRLPGPRARRRRAHDAHRRRRVRLRHRALPSPAREPLRRHCDDRPRARRRHHPVPQGRWHGRSVQPACGQPPDPGDPVPPDRRHPQRPHSRVHALDAAPLRRNAEDRRRPDRRAGQARASACAFDKTAIAKYQVA